MKKTDLKKKIVRNFLVSSLLLIVLLCSIFLSSYENSILNEKVTAIDSEISKIKEEFDELQSKSADIKKYVSLWDTISESKKITNGIRLDDINSLLSKTAERYSVTDYQIKVSSIPQGVQGGIFNCKTVSVVFTKVSLTFSAVNDVKALLFVDDLFSRIPGYGIITNLDISKTKDYSTDDLIKVSSGKGGNIAGKVDFIWYAYRAKENADPANIIKINQKENE
jgi:Tfp pilus assembly protein PilE